MIAGARTLAIMLIGVSAAVSPGHADRLPWLIWNATASVPIGLYAIHTVGALRVGDLVVATPPEPLASFLADRGYLPLGVPLMKHVAALPGQSVCRNRLTVSVDAVAVAEARERDSRDRPLPLWQGCRVIALGQVFLMNAHSADSLDGRYLGPLPAASIVGRAAPLWTHRTAAEE
jgi:conjugative transfer signal peptidase TraF